MGNFYVSQSTGSPSNPGTESLPWLTIKAAIAHNDVRAGDTIFVMNGSYYEQLVVNKAGLTIKNYAGHTPHVTGRADEEGFNTGLPQPLNAWTSVWGHQSSWSGLVTISVNTCVWDGIDIINGLGRGITVGPENDTVTVKNCTLSNHRLTNVNVYGTKNIFVDSATIENVESFESGMYFPSRARDQGALGWYNWPANFDLRGVRDIHVKDCKVYNTWGIGVLVDSNQGGSIGAIVEGCEIYNCFEVALYAQAVSDVVFQRNLIYSQAGNPYTGPNGGRSILVSAAEQSFYPRIVTNNVKIVSNIVLRQATGIATEGADRPLISDLLVSNNTVFNCSYGLFLTGLNISDAFLHNNIITNCTTPVFAGESASIIAARWTKSHNYWDTAVGVWGGTGDFIGNPNIVDRTFVPDTFSTPDLIASKAALNTGSNAKNTGINMASRYDATPYPADKQDYWGTNWGTYDIGAHEDSGVYGPTATAGAIPTSGEEDLSVAFTGNASGGTSPYTYHWNFGDGQESTSQNPTHLYTQHGLYTATLIVTDSSSEGLTDIDTVEITVEPVSQTTVEPVVFEKVEFAANDASYAVTGGAAPKAIFFTWTKATVVGTIVEDAVIGFGFWTPQRQVALCVSAKHGADVTVAGEETFEREVFVQMDASDFGSLGRGRVSSVSATTVSLTWQGGADNVKCTSINIYGSGVSNATVLIERIVSEATVLGEYNFLMAFTTLRNLGERKDVLAVSGGFAKRGANQAAAVYANRNASDTTEIVGGIKSDKIALKADWSDDVEISDWNSSQAVFSSGTTVEKFLTGLIMKLPDDLGIHIGLENLPIASGNTPYTAAGFNAQIMMGMVTNQTEADFKKETVAEAGVFGFFSVDAGGNDSIHIIASKALEASSIEHSLHEAKMNLLDVDGAKTLDAAGTIITGGWNLNTTTPLTPVQKILTCLIESTSTTTEGPTATFEFTSPYMKATGRSTPIVGETVTVTSTSSDDGTYSINQFLWEWSDGTADGTTNPETHVWTESGPYEVTLTVTDTNLKTHSITRLINVIVDDVDIVVDVDPATGYVPYALELDSSNSVAPAGGTIDPDETLWSLIPSGYENYYEAGRNGTIYSFKGETINFTMEEAGLWDVDCIVKLVGQVIGSDIRILEAVRALPALSGVITSNDGKIATTGPYEATLRLQTTRPNPGEADTVWNFGDGVIDIDVGITEQVHEYGAHADQYYTVFNGTNSIIVGTSPTSLDNLPNKGPMTVEAWVKADSLGENNEGCIFRKTNVASTSGWSLSITADGLKAVLAFDTTFAESVSGSDEFSPDGLWHHVAMTYDGTYDYPRIFVDGAEVSYLSTQNKSGSYLIDSASNLLIGNRGDQARTWDGGIGWVAIHSEILYTGAYTVPSVGGPPQTAPDLLEVYAMNDGSGSTVEAFVNSPTDDATFTNGAWANFVDPFVFTVSCDTTFPDGSNILVQAAELITIVPIPVAPKTVLQLLTELQSYQQLALNVSVHVGCIAGEWTQSVANPNVYSIVLDRIWATGMTIVVYEDGEPLTIRGTVPLVNDNPGSYRVNFSSPNLSIFVHTTNSDNPGLNGSSYRWGE